MDKKTHVTCMGYNYKANFFGFVFFNLAAESHYLTITLLDKQKIYN